MNGGELDSLRHREFAQFLIITVSSEEALIVVFTLMIENVDVVSFAHLRRIKYASFFVVLVIRRRSKIREKRRLKLCSLIFSGEM